MNYVDFSRTDLENNLTKDDSVKASVINIITTQRGTLPGFPEFGSDVYKFIFEPMTVFTKISLADNIKTALYKNDSRLDKVNVKIKEDKANYSILVDVEFTTKQNNNIEVITINLKGQ